MNSLWIALLSFVGFIAAYHLYGRYLGRRIFRINPQAVCPSRQFEDGIDYVPTRRLVLFGHHYTSIAGASPIVGPAIALFWGWLPALLWVVLGSIFAGAVHDFGALVLSARKQGKSVGDIAGDIISPATRVLFLLVVLFMVMIVIAVFALIIAGLFVAYPASVLPIWIEIPLALGVGAAVARRGANLYVWSLGALVLMMVSVWLSAAYLPAAWGAALGSIPVWVWILALLIYSYVASTLPVQRLLQPRDYINSHKLWLSLGLIVLGLIIVSVMAAFGAAPVPRMVAPAVRADPAGAQQMFPFLFVIIACGAISGFHSLVASGTTSKQLRSEADAQAIGYGGMLSEGVLSVVVIVACGAGIALAGGVGQFDTGAFDSFYGGWFGGEKLAVTLKPFITGASALLGYVGIPLWLGSILLAVFIISFAGTTLDTSCRIQRYVIGELARHARCPRLAGRYVATAIAVGTAAALAFLAGKGGSGGTVLWPLFGTVNQLLAGLALLVVTVWLFRRGTSIVYTMVPMTFVLLMTGWAMLLNLRGFAAKHNWLLVVIGAAVFVLELFIIGFAVHVFARGRARLGAPVAEPDI
jgi:carbon starvation protein